MLSADLQAAIRAAIKAALRPIAILNVDFLERQTYDGDEVIDILVMLPSDTGPLPPTKYMQAIGDVSRTLLRAHDERMPLFSTMRENEPDTVEGQTAVSS